MRLLSTLCAVCAVLASVGVAASQPPVTGGSGPKRPTFRAGGGRTGGGAEKPTEAPAPTPAPAGFSDALDLLSQIRRTAAVRSMAGRAWQVGPEDTPEWLIWVAGELDPVVAVKDDRWEDGGSVTIELEAPDGTSLEKRTEALDRDNRSFSIRLLHRGGFSPGNYTVRVTATPEARPSNTVETFYVSVPPSDAARPGPAGEPQLMRRGPFSGPDWMPTGDARYHRQERVKVETTVAGAVETSGVRLLDRAAHPLPLPASSAARFERGITTVSGEVALAPLSAGDYVLETTVTRGPLTERRYTAIRIVP